MNKLQIIKVRIKIPSKNSSSYESYSASISCTIRVKSPAYSEPKRPCEPTKLYQQPCITCLLLTMVILIANGWACKFHCNLWSKQFLISDSFIYFTKEYLTGAFSLYELDRLAKNQPAYCWPLSASCSLDCSLCSQHRRATLTIWMDSNSLMQTNPDHTDIHMPIIYMLPPALLVTIKINCDVRGLW